MPAASASSVGVSIPYSLHRANLFASGNVCGACDAFLERIAHNANMKMDKNLGPNYLSAWRKLRKMSQEELAEKVGTTKAVISLLESGDRPLSAKWLRKLAPALDTVPGYLLDHHPATLPADVLDIWSAIAERERPRALRVLESFRTGTND